MSEKYEAGQRRLSDIAKETAARNANLISKMSQGASPPLKEAMAEHGHATDESTVQRELLRLLLEKNAPRVDTQARTLISDAKTLADDIDVAGAAAEKAFQRWTAIVNERTQTLRQARMAVSAEINQTVQALKDASSFLAELGKGDAFSTLERFASLGKTLREAYGDMGLVRLADALLVISEIPSKGGSR